MTEYYVMIALKNGMPVMYTSSDIEEIISKYEAYVCDINGMRAIEFENTRGDLIYIPVENIMHISRGVYTQEDKVNEAN